MSAAQGRALRAIAAFEALKGLAALASALGLLGLLHHDLRRLALEMVGHFGLDPAQHFPSVFLHWVDLLNGTPVSTWVLLLGGYAALRLAEAYALWREHAWGALLGVLSGGLYIPFEMHHLLHQPSRTSAAVLAVNGLVVAFLAHRLVRGRAAQACAR